MFAMKITHTYAFCSGYRTLLTSSFEGRQGLQIGKKKVLSESALKEMVMPQQGELLNRVIKLVGGDNIIASAPTARCAHTASGQDKAQMWIHDNDLALIAPGDVQSDPEKKEIIHLNYHFSALGLWAGSLVR